MSSKENFNQAMFEMFGIGKDPNEKKAAENSTNNKDEVKTEMKKEVKPEIKKETAPAAKPAAKTAYPKTILAEGTVFEGNLTSKGDVEIGGQLKGNVVTEGNIVLHSEILGDVKAANLDILSDTLTCRRQRNQRQHYSTEPGLLWQNHRRYGSGRKRMF